MSDPTGVPMIEPRLVHEVFAVRDRMAGTPTLRFAGDSLYVMEGVWNDPPTRILWWHAPDGAVIALPLCCLALLWAFRRALKGPRSKGTIYCRSCNSELGLPHATLTPDGRSRWLSESARCPECGRRARSPVVGSGRGWRWVPTVLLLMGAVGCGGALWKTLVPYNPTMPQVYKTWPWRGLEKPLGRWAVMRKDIGFGSSGMRRATRIGLPSGIKTQVLKTNVFGWNVDLVSPDGRYMVWSSRQEPGRMSILDTQSDTKVQIGFAGGEKDTSIVAGYSADRRFVYVKVEDFEMRRPDRLFEVELATGRSRLLASVFADATLSAPGPGSVASRFVVRGGPHGPSWAHVSFSTTGTSRVTSVTVQAPSADGMRKFVAPVNANFLSHLAWHPDLDRLLVTGEWTTSLVDVIPIDGGLTKHEHRLFPFHGIERGVRIRVDQADLAILQQDERRLAVLRGAGIVTARNGDFSISPDGTWAAAIVFSGLQESRPLSLPASAPGARYEVWLWDLCRANSLLEEK